MIEITVDPSAFVAVTAQTASQLPYATMRALNDTAVQFQNDERSVLQADMTIRRPWVLQGVKINRGDFATKANLEVRISVDPSRSFLDKFEDGGIRMPLQSKALSVPLAARRIPQALVPNALRPKNLGFAQVASSGVNAIFKGAQRTILIQRPDGSGVILQRKGRKASFKKRRQGPLMAGQRHDDALVVLYVLRPRTPVPSLLKFAATAKESFMSNWPRIFTGWWNTAVATAR